MIHLAQHTVQSADKHNLQVLSCAPQQANGPLHLIAVLAIWNDLPTPPPYIPSARISKKVKGWGGGGH